MEIKYTYVNKACEYIKSLYIVLNVVFLDTLDCYTYDTARPSYNLLGL